MTTKIQKIDRGMVISKIFSNFPHKAQRIAYEMTKAGLQCAGCNAATWETLEAGMMGHGKKDEEINQLIDILNAILEEETDLTTITLTDRAAKKYLEILKEDGKEGWGMRLSEEMVGCSGFEYVLDYSKEAQPDDTTYVTKGIEIHINNGLVERMIGSEVDYIDSLQGAGFKVTNPNVRSSCGCGSSHGY